MKTGIYSQTCNFVTTVMYVIVSKVSQNVKKMVLVIHFMHCCFCMYSVSNIIHGFMGKGYQQVVRIDEIRSYICILHLIDF